MIGHIYLVGDSVGTDGVLIVMMVKYPEELDVHRDGKGVLEEVDECREDKKKRHEGNIRT